MGFAKIGRNRIKVAFKNCVLGTDPRNQDSDGDGLRDGFEVINGFNPLVVGEEAQDPDGDGLDNLGEQNAGTNPLNVDTDSGGRSDGEEVLIDGTDALNTADDI